MADSHDTRSASARHTPGPWHKLRDPKGNFGIAGEDGVFLAVVEGRDNANLIVAAPELVEMVRELKLLFQSALLCTTPQIAKDGMVFVRKADALLAKAEGR